MSQPLRIVVGAHAFAHPGGTETYAYTVARELQRLGHEPVIWAEELGEMAEHAERNALPVARTGPPEECDAILAQDAVAASLLAARLPAARLVQVAHSDLHDHQLPVLLDGVVDAVVAMSDRVAARVEATSLAAPVVRLRQPIDTELFRPDPPIGARPRRALLLSNYLDGPRCRALTDAWEAAGVECIRVGKPTEHSVDPAAAIAGVDIVVGKARAALEGMSSARAVYVFDEYGGDGWVTPDRYDALEADNFAGLMDAPRTPADLAADLAGYDEAMGWLNRELVKRHHRARGHAIELVEVLRPTGAERRAPAVPLEQVAWMTRAAWQAERRTLVAEVEAARLRGRTLAAEEELAQRRRREAGLVAGAEVAAAREAELAAAADAWRERAQRAEALLETRRARVGIVAGRALDQVLRRG